LLAAQRSTLSKQSTSSKFNKSNSITVHADTGWYSFKVAARSVRYNEFAFVMAFFVAFVEEGMGESLTFAQKGTHTCRAARFVDAK
jgi:hypothetical protein